MHKPFRLYDSKFKKHYIACGSFLDLVILSKLRIGIRNYLDQIILLIQSVLHIKFYHVIVPEIISRRFNNYLLFDTSWYKDTLFIGYAKQEQNIFFIKVYRNINDSLFQQHQGQFIEKYFSMYFVICPVLQVDNNVVIYDYCRIEKLPDNQEVINKIIDHNNFMLRNNVMQKPVKNILPPDFSFMFKEWNSILSHKITTWSVAQLGNIPLIPIHGDMTPWNMGKSKDGQVILLDYELAGWHVPLYDYFHFILQPIALKKPTVSIYKTGINLNLQHAETAIILYLADQIYYELDKVKNQKFNDRPLMNLLNNKTQWLLELLDN